MKYSYIDYWALFNYVMSSGQGRHWQGRFTKLCLDCTYKTWLHLYPTLHFIINRKNKLKTHVVHKFKIDQSLTAIT